LSRRLCLITGASAGIGAAFARTYARHGWDVALTARRRERLDALAAEIREAHGVETLVLPADLTEPSAPGALIAEIERAGRAVDGLVNNAGYGGRPGFASADWQAHAAFLQVMLTAPVELAHRVAPRMAERGFGRIVNVASLAGMLPSTAGDILYGPAKSFLIKFSRGLRQEMTGRGVHVTALCPGYTLSEFHDANGAREAVTRAVPPWMWMSPADTAEAGYVAVEANRAIAVPGLAYKTAAAMLKALPDDITFALTAGHARKLDAGKGDDAA